jgi:hypothetical protein
MAVASAEWQEQSRSSGGPGRSAAISCREYKAQAWAVTSQIFRVVVAHDGEVADSLSVTAQPQAGVGTPSPTPDIFPPRAQRGCEIRAQVQFEVECSCIPEAHEAICRRESIFRLRRVFLSGIT